MSTTHIRDKAEQPAKRAEDGPSRSGRRRTAVAVTLFVAAIALVAAGAVWFTGIAADDGPSTPRPTPTADELAAQDFLTAFTTFDAEGVALHLADGASMPQEWWRDLKRYEAFGIVFLVQPCQEVSSSSTETNVACPFDFHAFGTDELGSAPFGRNDFALRVDNGKVESFEVTYNTSINGFDQHYDVVGSWVRANHPGDWELMDSYEDVRSADFAGWLQLWEERLAEYENRVSKYVEATTPG